MEKLTILILTHNRPKLFERCLNSVLKNIPEYVEVIVNNDSNDIIEIPHSQVKYYYYQNDNIGYIYDFLLRKSKTNYIYFLEDDDYILPNFWKTIILKNSIYQYIPDGGYKQYLKFFKNDKDFKRYFQLGQIIFNKNYIIIPKDNNINNDWNIYIQIKDWEYIKKPIYRQTTDGKDNISFKEFNNDRRF